jgi:PAS domain S-box-containing protein
MTTQILDAPRKRREEPLGELVLPQKLYGRERELAALSDAFAHVTGGRGQVLLVSGKSGSGKTALVRALRPQALNENGFFLEGKFNQYQRDIPYFALRQALRQLVREVGGTSGFQRRRWSELIQEAVGGLGRLLTDLVPELRLLIGEQPPVPDISPYEAPHRFAAVLRRFLGVFCQPEHPVVLFVDDWQWADAASLAVLRRLEVNTTLRYLLVIAAYRDNEVDAVHPLTSAVEDLSTLAVPVQRLNVGYLAMGEVMSLLADALPPSINDPEGLAEAIHHNTAGNPFYTRAILDELRERHAVWFNQPGQVWRWSRARIEDEGGGGDVVQLFVRKLHDLPPASRDLLSLAACIGSRFDLDTLALAAELCPHECRPLLDAPLKQHMIQSWEESRDEPEEAVARPSREFVFQHDRVQQAAYSLLSPEDIPAMRLRLGRLLVSRLTPEQLQERLLETTDHLNAGRDLIEDDAERLRLVELNIAAGHKARLATAYRAALRFHRVAGEFMACPEFAARFWEQRHDLALQLCKEWAETEFLEGDRTEAEQCIHQAVAHARTPLEQADALCVLIVQHTLLARYPEAIDAGRQALVKLGVALPESDWDAARDAEIAQVRQRLEGRSAASLRQLPRMTDPVILMATKVLITMGPPCYRSHPRLWSVIVAKVVDLTLEYGHIPQVGYSHTGFGGLLMWVANDSAAAFDLGALAERLMDEEFSSLSDQSVYHLMSGSSLRHWFEHLSAASRDYARAWETGLRSGNLQYAAYAAGHNMYCRFYQGAPLPELMKESESSLQFSRTRTNLWAMDLLEGGLRVFGGLAGAAAETPAESCAEEEYLRRLTANQNTQVACIYHVLKTFSHLVLGEYEQGLRESEEAEALIPTVGVQGLLPWPEHVVTRLLLLATLPPSADAERQAAHRREIDRILGRLETWAKQCPANYRHKLSLGRAEAARLDGHPLEALRLYEQAIEEAVAEGFVQWEALANERAADLARECGEYRLAQVYWQNAYVGYHRWGARDKLRRMEAELRGAVASGLGAGVGENEGLAGALNLRLARYLQDSLARASSTSDDEGAERARLFEELTQAAQSLREEVAQRKRMEAELERHREQLAEEVQERTAARDRAEQANEALRESEARLHHAVEALRESEERFRLVSKATNDALWDWDLLTNSVRWIEGVEALFGYTCEEVEQNLESWSNRIHPDDRDRTLASLHHTLAGEEAYWSAEYRYRCRNESYIYVLDRGYVLRDAAGKPTRMIGGMTDLTERRSLEAQLLQSQKTDAIGRLAGGVAHDFNNLLTVINGYSEMLMSMTPGGDPKRPLLADIRDAGERAANLTRQLLAFSRKQVLAPRILDLNEVVSNLQKILQRLIGEDVHISSVLAPDLRRVKVDPGQLEQVIINLAVNARDAMPRGGRLTIETENVQYVLENPREEEADGSPQTFVALTISDTGCGMSPEVQARIFEPFFTTKEPGKGTGLGLATVFGIVKQSDGLIDVESKPGAGTSFRILFPAVLEQVNPGPLRDSPVGRGNETVLLVEDADAVRRVARRALETHGYRVLEARNGREALGVIESHERSIHLVVTDVVMPEMSGRELVEHLRRRRAGAKVLFMSGYTDDAVVRNGVTQATDAFLQKPFTPLALARKVREVLEA